MASKPWARELPVGALQHGDPLLLAGQIGGCDSALQRQLLGQVSEGEQGDAIGPHFAHLRRGGVKALRGLQGQPADQVHIHAVEGGLPQPLHGVPQLLRRHNPVHGLLHLGVGVLDAEADAVEAQLAQLQGPVAAEEFRVHLDRGLQVGLQIEVLGDQVPELALLGGMEVVGGAAPPVQLGQAPPCR